MQLMNVDSRKNPNHKHEEYKYIFVRGLTLKFYELQLKKNNDKLKNLLWKIEMLRAVRILLLEK